MRVLVFGDSITQGYWAVEAGWVERLRKHYDKIQVEDLHTKDEPTIFNLGISANRSSDVLARITSETQARIGHNHPVAVLVQIGINDSSVSRDSVDVSQKESVYRKNLVKIVNEIKPIAKKIIFIGLSACDESKTVPVFWNDIDYTNQRIKAYEDAMRDIAKENGVDFIPVFERFKAKLDGGEDLLADGLHPNDAGHQVIYEIVQPELDKLLI